MKRKYVVSVAMTALLGAALSQSTLANNLSSQRPGTPMVSPRAPGALPNARQAHPGFAEILSRLNSHTLPDLERLKADPKYANSLAQNDLNAAIAKVKACIVEIQAAERTAAASEPAMDLNKASDLGLKVEKQMVTADPKTDPHLRGAQEEMAYVTGMIYEVRMFFDQRLMAQHATQIDENMRHIMAAADRLMEASKATGSAAHPAAMQRAPGVMIKR